MGLIECNFGKATDFLTSMELLYRGRFSTWNTQVLLLFIGLFVCLFENGFSCDLTSPCKKQCVNGKCTTTESYDRQSQTTASLAAVITVCTILMLCFWGLLCFACFKQCKDCTRRSSMSSCESMNSVAIDISSIEIPDDFFRNARIPSAEEYTGPPPYLHLFNPKIKPQETKKQELQMSEKPSVLNELPPLYKSLFTEQPPSYNEVVLQEQVV